jgi:hypothetical protein
MVYRLFEDFLDNVQQYRASERYWEDLVRDVARTTGQSGEWQPWIPRQFADGTPMELDGNPIFDGRSQKLSRAFRIMQHRPVSDEVEFAAWLKEYEKEFSDLPRMELVMNLSLSQESAELAKELLTKWMTPGTSKEEMESLMHERLGSS